MYTDFLKKTWKISCMGCGIASHQASPPYGIIFETRHFIVHQDPLIPLRGFVILASKRHIQSIIEMNEEEYTEYCEIVRKIRISFPKGDDLLNITLIQEEASKHFHLWFFPWYSWMKFTKVPKLAQIRGIMANFAKNEISKHTLKEIERLIRTLRGKMSEKSYQH